MKKNIRSSLKAFIISFFTMLLIMLPIIVTSKGYFIYGGDYNYQHIIFNTHVYNMIRSGKYQIDMMNSLGVDFLISYSHIIFTPFFLLSLVLPSVKAFVFSLPVFTALKVAVASVTAYIYIRRYVKNDDSAVVGAFLYAFSGYQSFSFVFGSFNDITAWFPLMLFFLDEYFYNNRKGCFLLIVACMAALNSFFFYGQVMFIIIYFLIKFITKEYKVNLKNFLGLAAESVIGFLMSFILLYPGVKSLTENSRVSRYINGMDMLSYSDRSVVWRTLQSIFMMPDIAGKTSLFEGDNTWASLSLYLPCVGIVFVAAYIRNNIRNWDAKLIIVSVIMALIPALNSVFFMFNETYYARWFYMPVLIMSLVTARELDNYDKEKVLFGVKISAVSLLFFALISFLPAEISELSEEMTEIKRVRFAGFPVDSIIFWKYLGLSSLFILLIYFINSKYSLRTVFMKKLMPLTLSGIVILNIVYFSDVNSIDTDTPEKFISANLNGPELEKKDGEYYRINEMDSNANLVWDEVASIDNFITAVPSSVVDFYDELGINRTQIAWFDSRYYPLYSLLSCKYYLNASTGDDLNVEYHPNRLENFEKDNIQPYYHVYKNKAYIPIGFMYDYYITESSMNSFVDEYAKEHPYKDDAESEPEETDDENVMNKALKNIVSEAKYSYDEKYFQKMLAMFRAVVISDESETEVSKYIQAIPSDMLKNMSSDTYYSDCEDRKEKSCNYFECTSDGFTAKINSESENYVFFSVPYMEGWSAKVNGEDAEVVKVNYGFMAVKVDEGDNDIVFSYENPDYRTGGIISCVGLGMFAVYMIVNYMIYKRKDRNEVKG